MCAESLAYLAAATHNLTDEADQLQSEISPNLPSVDPHAVVLQPPVPIMQQESNWPLLTVSKSIFEGTVAASSKCEFSCSFDSTCCTTNLQQNQSCGMWPLLLRDTFY